MLLKKRKQANMIRQLKNASAKLAKVQAGQRQVSHEEKVELRAKHDLWKEYTSLEQQGSKEGCHVGILPQGQNLFQVDGKNGA